MPEEIKTEAVKADKENDSETSFIQEIFAETQEKALLLVDEISKKSAELAVALEEVKKRESQVIARDNDLRKENIRLQQWQNKLNSKQADVDRQEQKNKEQAYSIHRSIFSKTFCKDSLIKLYGKDYWLELIQKMYELGEEIEKSKLQVQMDLDCYLVDIYMCFNMYEEAYNILCIQAKYSLIFFSSIAQHSTLLSYKQHLEKCETTQLNDDLISQIYICSIICDKKFKYYKRGLLLASIGSLLFVTLFVIGLIVI